MTSRTHTSDLDAVSLEGIRALLDDAFADFTDEDWEHALGGIHVLLSEEGELVGHAAVVQRRLVHRGVGIRTGYVEGVAVRADRRGRGCGDAAMGAAEDVVRRAYDLGALSAGAGVQGFYTRRGWRRWEGETWALGPRGPERTADEDGGLLVLATPTSPDLDLTGTIACDWRPGDVW